MQIISALWHLRYYTTNVYFVDAFETGRMVKRKDLPNRRATVARSLLRMGMHGRPGRMLMLTRGLHKSGDNKDEHVRPGPRSIRRRWPGLMNHLFFSRVNGQVGVHHLPEKHTAPGWK